MRRAIQTLIVVAVVVLAGCSASTGDGAVEAQKDVGEASGDRVGVAVGGAQDANAFRRNVENGYVPQPTDLSYEGLFHDYYFDTASDRKCEARFCPSYSTAVTRDPLSNETERFVSVGLNSGLTESDVQRDPINLVVVLDTSGSMEEEFDEYHGGDGGTERESDASKMTVATDAVASMFDHLGPRDRVGVVAFDNTATVVQDLQGVDDTDMERLRSDVQGLTADGGTNLDTGMVRARELLPAEPDRQSRIVYVTDAMPNEGNTSGPALEERVSEYASEGVSTTVVGVGVDFNSEFTRHIATTEGANYYTVESPAGFDRRMDETFSYMVTPLAHNLTLRAVGAEIEHVYGSTQGNNASARLVHVSTLFPSRRENNRTEGGVILLELADGSTEQLRLVATYEDPNGDRHRVVREVAFSQDAPYYGSPGVRKAVTLAEYGTLMRNWMAAQRNEGVEPPGAAASIEHREYADSWAQEPIDLAVSDPYDDRIESFIPYFRRQMETLDADRMQRDLRVLRTLAEAGGAETGGATVVGDATVVEEPEGQRGEDSSAAGFLGSLGHLGVLVGLVNLVVTVSIAAYGIGQKRKSRNREGNDQW